MNAAFVTATGTDIGKTYVTAGLLRALRVCGDPAGAIKPVMSGYDEAAAAASDAGILLAAMGQPASPENIAAIAPWRFAAPISPDMAAAREGRILSLPEIARFCENAIAEAPGTLLIEGAGGAMAPLSEAHTMRDLIAALRLPVLLITGSYLGAISHTLTTAEALSRAAGMAGIAGIAGIVISESATSPVPPRATADSIARFAPGIALYLIRRDAGAADFLPLARLFGSAGGLSPAAER